MEQTITEALAELKTISKRIEKKRSFVTSYLLRPDAQKDPLIKEGGSPELVKRERQAIKDLEKRHIAIRMAIQRSNLETVITVEGISKSVAEWLTWRKEVAPDVQRDLNNLKLTIERARQAVQKLGGSVVVPGADSKPQDIVVNVEERELASDMELMESILGTLDGQLSLRNATTTIDI